LERRLQSRSSASLPFSAGDREVQTKTIRTHNRLGIFQISIISRHFCGVATLDRLAAVETPLQRIDARAKLIVTLALLAAVVSYDKYTVAALLPFIVFPVTMAIAGRIPIKLIVTGTAAGLPFALAVCIFNPLLDREPMLQLHGIAVSGGWVSLTSVLLKFSITVSSTIILLATTGITNICLGLQKMGIPESVTVQILLMYRYIFVLLDEFRKITRSHNNRTFGRERMRICTYTAILKSLLQKSITRSQRIFRAMQNRGFNGRIIAQSGKMRFTSRDAIFTICALTAITILRFNLYRYAVAPAGGEF